jgi:hypothetical protein
MIKMKRNITLILSKLKVSLFAKEGGFHVCGYYNDNYNQYHFSVDGKFEFHTIRNYML